MFHSNTTDKNEVATTILEVLVTSDKQRGRRTRLLNGGLFLLLRVSTSQHSTRSLRALLCRRLRELDINISLIQEPWAYQGKIRGMAKLYYCTSEARPTVCIHAKGVDATQMPGFCHRDLVAMEIKVIDDTKGKTREVIVGSAYFPYGTKRSLPWR
ncbi:hypothetical protein JTB14_015464 [Gonioctena quinquepunctata]|nr:hypothetical protein JTB14_015464 [Gonioctena quinquepunctata]